MAIELQTTENNIYRIVQAIRELIQGRSNATKRVTLTPNATTTVVTAKNCSKDSEIFLSPRTANAAAAVATTYISSVGQGTFTITHANNAQVDKTFGIIGLGG